MKTYFRSALERLAAAIGLVVIALAVIMLAVLSLQIFTRFVFDLPLSWTEELALGCFTWAVLLAIALGVRNSIHVRMDLIIDRLPVGPRKGLEMLILLATCGFGVFVAWSGVRYVIDALGTTSAAIGYPISFLYASAPVSGALIAIFALEHMFLGAPLHKKDISA